MNYDAQLQRTNAEIKIMFETQCRQFQSIFSGSLADYGILRC